MLKKKLLALFIIASFISSLIIPKASAESIFQAEKFPYKSMQIQVMPEFDYPENWPSRDIPSLLVGMYGTITNKSGEDYDGKIEIPIPVNDKGFQPILVAEFPKENEPEVQRPFDVDKENGIITWKPKSAIKNNATYSFVIEYYTQTIDVKDQKGFTYEFSSNAEIEQMDIVIYAPMNSENIQLEPKAMDNSKNEYGQEIYFYQYKNVKAGEPYKYAFSYKKDGNESSLEAFSKAQPPNDKNHAGVNGTATDQIANSNRPIITVGGASIIGIAIIIAALFVYLGLKGNAQNQANRTKQTKPQQKKTASKPKENASIIAEAKKELRKKLLTGKMDQEMYDEEMKKLI